MGSLNLQSVHISIMEAPLGFKSEGRDREGCGFEIPGLVGVDLSWYVFQSDLLGGWSGSCSFSDGVINVCITGITLLISVL